MFKKLFVLSLVVVSLFLFTGCGKKDGSGVIKIRFENAEAVPQQIQTMREIVSKFEAKNPDIKVQLTYGVTLEKTLAEIAAGDPPDAFMYWADLMNLVGQGALTPLNDYVKKYNVDMSSYWKQLNDLYTFDGKLYAFPLQLKTCTLIFNKDMFDKAGLPYPTDKWTWSDYYRVAKQLKKDMNGDKVNDQFGSLVPYANYWILMNGGKIIDENKKVCVVDKDPKSIEAMKFWLKFVNDCCPALAEESSFVGGAGTAGFMSGKVAMVIAPTWMLSSFKDIKNFQWDMVSVPKPDNGKLVELYEGAALCIPTKIKNPEAAFRFVAFYCGPEGMELFAKGRNGIPAMKKSAYEIFAAPPHQNLKYYLTAAEKSTVYTGLKTIKNSTEVMEPFGRNVELARLGKVPMDEALKNIAKEINQKLKDIYKQ